MKNFLKSTAIFACIALLLGACSEDSTEDIYVDSSTIRSVTPGDGKFEVKWTVPNDENITRCVISWSGDNGVDDSYCVEVEQGTNVQTITGVAAGTYTVTVENYGDVQINSDAYVFTESIYVYDYTSFTLPTVSSVMNELADENDETMNVYIEWKDVSEDCKGVIVSYLDANKTTVKSSLLSASGTTVLEGVGNNSGTYTYTAFFQPEGGLDETLLSGGSVSVADLSNAPSAPTNIVVSSGDYEFYVAWDLDDSDTEAATATRSMIIYDNGEEAQYFYASSLSSTGNKAQIPVSEVGSTYSISVRNISAGGTLSDATAGDSDAVPYDWAVYEESASIPEITGVLYNDTTFYMTINWVATLECDEVNVKYVDNTEAISEFTIPRADMELGVSMEITPEYLENRYGTESTSITGYALPGSAYTITTTFCPAGNGMHTVTKAVTDKFPDAGVTKYLGYWNSSKKTKYYEIVQQHLNGDATIDDLYDTSDVDNNRYHFWEMFDDTYSYNSTSTAGYYTYVTEADSTSKYQTVSFDLGRTYKLSEMSYTPLWYQYFGSTRPTVKRFSLYGSNLDPTAEGNEDMNAATAETEMYLTYQGGAYSYLVLPDLTSSKWYTLLDNVEVVPAYTNATNPYDYNGDGVIDVNDDYDLIADNAIRYTISDEFPAVRYIRFQFIENFAGTTSYSITELDFWHRGVFSSDEEAKDFQDRVDAGVSGRASQYTHELL
ncbi:MAG: DUF4998 domain-containing protein [Rikenellaceae bacterium]